VRAAEDEAIHIEEDHKMSRIFKNIAFTLVAAGVALGSATARAQTSESGNANKKFTGRYICVTTADNEYTSTVIVIVPNGDKAGTFSYGSLNLFSDNNERTEDCGGLECPCNYTLDVDDSGYGVDKGGEALATLIWDANPSNDETCGPGWETGWVYAVTKNKAVTKMSDENVGGIGKSGPGQCNKEAPIPIRQ
jgi:hypothetical protein